MEHVDFISPIDIGEVVVVEAYVFNVGRTSIDVKVDVRAENPVEGTDRPTTSSFFTFVALDDEGVPTDVPELVCPSEAEEALRQEAVDGRKEQLSELVDRLES